MKVASYLKSYKIQSPLDIQVRKRNLVNRYLLNKYNELGYIKSIDKSKT